MACRFHPQARAASFGASFSALFTRALVIPVMGVALVAVFPQTRAQALPLDPSPHAASYDFAAYYGGEHPLGTHKVVVTPQADGSVAVDVTIDFKVKLAFMTAFRYHHSDHEVWRDGRLLSIDSVTDDDGTRDWVNGRAAEDGFHITSSRGSALAPADIQTTTYWNPGLRQASYLLDSVRGVVMNVATELVGQEMVDIADGMRVPARHYRLRLLSNKPQSTDSVDLWYDGGERWVKLAFDARGRHVDYVMAATPPAPPIPAPSAPIPTPTLVVAGPATTADATTTSATAGSELAQRP